MGTAVPQRAGARKSQGVRKTLDGVIFLTGPPSCLDPAWCPGGRVLLRCCLFVGFPWGRGCRVCAVTVVLCWVWLCSRVRRVCRGVLGDGWCPVYS